MSTFSLTFMIMLIIFIISFAFAQDCSVHTDCNSCITNPLLISCGWCESSTPPNNIYCISAANEADCNGTFHNPQGKIEFTARDFSDTIVFSPTDIKASLRPGISKFFRLTVKQSNNYPVDLYYLMDLSGSMGDDLQHVKSNAGRLESWLRSKGSNNYIGFGSFVEKPRRSGDGDYVFKNTLPLQKSVGGFQSAVSNGVGTRYGKDGPECGLEALIQVAMCKSAIQWRDDARRIVFFTTDADYHYGGDAKALGITEPNDGLCKLTDNEITSETALDQDYPSIGVVKDVLEKNNIYPIFAINRHEALYRDLIQLLNTGSVSSLSSNSGNMEAVLNAAYLSLTREVRVATLPDSADYVKEIVIEGNPSNGKFPAEASVNDVTPGTPITFVVTLLLKERNDEIIPDISVIVSGADLKIKIGQVNLCNCTNSDESIPCNNEGITSCGKCSCNEGYYGHACECQGDNIFCSGQTLIDLEGPNGKLCSGRGKCECGKCTCQEQTAVQIGYTGRKCECRICPKGDVFGQPGEKKTCGGSEQGVCECGKCQCTDDFSHDKESSVQTCSCPINKVSNDACTPDVNFKDGASLPCNGKATCTCGKCGPCEKGFSGERCENCDEEILSSLGETCPKILECISANTCTECFDKSVVGDELCSWCPGNSSLILDLTTNATLKHGCYPKGIAKEVCECDKQNSSSTLSSATREICNLHVEKEQCAGCEQLTNCYDCQAQKREKEVPNTGEGVCEWCGDKCVEYEMKMKLCDVKDRNDKIKCDLVCIASADESTCKEKEKRNSELLNFACKHNGDANAVPPEGSSFKWPWCYSPSDVPKDVCDKVEWVLLWAERCPKPINKGAIIGGTIGGIVGAALLALLAWKIIASLQDKAEWQKWETDRAASKWEASQNPLFKSSTTDYLNPIYS